MYVHVFDFMNFGDGKFNGRSPSLIDCSFIISSPIIKSVVFFSGHG